MTASDLASALRKRVTVASAALLSAGGDEWLPSVVLDVVAVLVEPALEGVMFCRGAADGPCWRCC